MLAGRDIEPFVAVQWLRVGVTRETVADVLVLTGEEAVIAVVALGHIDDQVPLLHDQAVSGPAVL